MRVVALSSAQSQQGDLEKLLTEFGAIFTTPSGLPPWCSDVHKIVLEGILDSVVIKP